ncbi:hypothetical protein EW146_g6592 [Bondarzewia mesenterica]|uniref:Uncharacterized protein n=1 Tax=Bondarzewia mesenterica TaxID=1095465 RepID=A0A4S4LN31_9AGAM|nr:hypothetical protein EW146_g6592 [Bondarzewia mesenterica]
MLIFTFSASGPAMSSNSQAIRYFFSDTLSFSSVSCADNSNALYQSMHEHARGQADDAQARMKAIQNGTDLTSSWRKAQADHARALALQQKLAAAQNADNSKAK